MCKTNILISAEVATVAKPDATILLQYSPTKPKLLSGLVF
jgi:hypothetical protein